MIKPNELKTSISEDMKIWEDKIDKFLIANAEKVLSGSACWDIPTGLSMSLIDIIVNRYNSNGYEATYESYQREGSWIRFKVK